VDVRAAFNALVGHLEYPMFIVTARAGGEPLGCLVGFATQTSIDPPRFLVCLSQANRTYRLGRDSEHLGVHCVPADAGDLAELFGGETADEVDKFTRVAWHEGPGGVPILDRCRNWFVGRVVARGPAGWGAGPPAPGGPPTTPISSIRSRRRPASRRTSPSTWPSASSPAMRPDQ
jgi:flavin reductase (DIM6/NTAB) family NADH-FMN oxidoreductase RutF